MKSQYSTTLRRAFIQRIVINKKAPKSYFALDKYDFILDFVSKEVAAPVYCWLAASRVCFLVMIVTLMMLWIALSSSIADFFRI